MELKPTMYLYKREGIIMLKRAQTFFIVATESDLTVLSKLYLQSFYTHFSRMGGGGYVFFAENSH
jgi:hypothetical protein